VPGGPDELAELESRRTELFAELVHTYAERRPGGRREGRRR
jgi:hypothetical protein